MTTTKPTAAQRRLMKAAAAGDDGLPVGEPRLGRWQGLIRAGLVVRGPTPPRNAAGRLVYSRRLFITPAGRAAVEGEK